LHIFDKLDLEKYYNVEIRVRGYLRSSKAGTIRQPPLISY